MAAAAATSGLTMFFVAEKRFYDQAMVGRLATETTAWQTVKDEAGGTHLAMVVEVTCKGNEHYKEGDHIIITTIPIKDKTSRGEGHHIVDCVLCGEPAGQRPMVLSHSAGDMQTVRVNSADVLTCYGECWDEEAGDWRDDDIQHQDGGLLDNYGSMRAQIAHHNCLVDVAHGQRAGSKRARASDARSSVAHAARVAKKAMDVIIDLCDE